MAITDNDIKYILTHYNMMGYYQWLLNLQTDMDKKNEILVFLKHEYRDLKQYFSEDILRIKSYEYFIKVKEEARRNRQIKSFVNEMPKNIRDWYNEGFFSENLKELCYLSSIRQLEPFAGSRYRDFGREFLQRISKYRYYSTHEVALADLGKELYDFVYGSLVNICSMDQAIKIIEKIQTENWKVVYKNELSGIVLFRAFNNIGVHEIASDTPWCTKSSEYFRSYVGSRSAIKYIALMDYTQDKQVFNDEVKLTFKKYFEKMAFVFHPENQYILSAFDHVNHRVHHPTVHNLLANKIPKKDMVEIFGKRFVERISEEDVEFSKFSINKLGKNPNEDAESLSFLKIFWTFMLFVLTLFGSYLLYNHLVK